MQPFCSVSCFTKGNKWKENAGRPGFKRPIRHTRVFSRLLPAHEKDVIYIPPPRRRSIILHALFYRSASIWEDPLCSAFRDSGPRKLGCGNSGGVGMFSDKKISHIHEALLKKYSISGEFFAIPIEYICMSYTNFGVSTNFIGVVPLKISNIAVWGQYFFIYFHKKWMTSTYLLGSTIYISQFYFIFRISKNNVSISLHSKGIRNFRIVFLWPIQIIPTFQSNLYMTFICSINSVTYIKILSFITYKYPLAIWM